MLKDLLTEISDDALLSMAEGFTVEITDARVVPSVDDPGITFEDLDLLEKKCKKITTCVLYVDLRNSTKTSDRFSHEDLTKIYSTFVTSTIRACEYYNGYIRNIVGDRVMVLFNTSTCFTDAMNTAILLNTVVNHLLAKQHPNCGFKCGIGIDYGEMLITKTGVIKKGKENAPNRSLVWLGRPANVASKLTDIANKTSEEVEDTVQEGFYYRAIDEWLWFEVSLKEFIKKLNPTYTGNTLTHKESNFLSFFLSSRSRKSSNLPILVTQEVYDGFLKANPNDTSFKENRWVSYSKSIPGYKGKVWGMGDYFIAVDEVLKENA